MIKTNKDSTTINKNYPNVMVISVCAVEAEKGFIIKGDKCENILQGGLFNPRFEDQYKSNANWGDYNWVFKTKDIQEIASRAFEFLYKGLTVKQRMQLHQHVQHKEYSQKDSTKYSSLGKQVMIKYYPACKRFQFDGDHYRLMYGLGDKKTGKVKVFFKKKIIKITFDLGLIGRLKKMIKAEKKQSNLNRLESCFNKFNLLKSINEGNILQKIEIESQTKKLLDEFYGAGTYNRIIKQKKRQKEKWKKNRAVNDRI